MKNIFLYLLLLLISVGTYAQSPINLKTQTNIDNYISNELSGRLVDTLSTLADTTAAANNIGRIVHVIAEDAKWTVNSAGAWEVLSGLGGTDDQTAAEVSYTNNGQTTVAGGLDSLFNRPVGIDTLSTLADTSTANTGIGQLVYVNSVDQYWHVQSDGFFYLLETGGGAGVTDGDKGDVTVSSSGAVWNINESAKRARVNYKPSLGVVIGNSTVAAYSGTTAIADFLDVNQSLGDTVISIAVPGHTIDQQEAAFLNHPRRADFDYAILQIGLNDMNPSIWDSLSLIQNYQNLVNEIRAVNPRIVLVGATMIPAYERWVTLYGANADDAQDNWEDLNEAIVEGYIKGIDYSVSKHTFLLGNPSDRRALAPLYDTGDGIHENDAGRELIASQWQRILNEAGFLEIPAATGGSAGNPIGSIMYMLFTGQSNAGTAAISAGGDLTPDDRVQIFNKTTNQFETWEPTVNGTGFQLAKHIVENNHYDTVRVVHEASGGKAIFNWLSGGVMYNKIQNQMDSIAIHVDSIKFETLLWVQGENDNTHTDVNYQNKFSQMIELFKSNWWFDDAAKILLHGLVTVPGATNSERDYTLRLMGMDSLVMRNYINSNGVSSYDSLHFNGSAIDTMGLRAYEVWLGTPYKYNLKEGIIDASSAGISLVSSKNGNQIVMKTITGDAVTEFNGVINISGGNITIANSLPTQAPTGAGSEYFFDWETYPTGIYNQASDTITPMKRYARFEDYNGSRWISIGSIAVTDSTWLSDSGMLIGAIPYSDSAKTVTMKMRWINSSGLSGPVLQMSSGGSNDEGYGYAVLFDYSNQEIGFWYMDGGATSGATLLSRTSHSFTTNTDYYYRFQINDTNDTVSVYQSTEYSGTYYLIASQEVTGNLSGGVGFWSSNASQIYYDSIQVKIGVNAAIDPVETSDLYFLNSEDIQFDIDAGLNIVRASYSRSIYFQPFQSNGVDTIPIDTFRTEYFYTDATLNGKAITGVEYGLESLVTTRSTLPRLLLYKPSTGVYTSFGSATIAVGNSFATASPNQSIEQGDIIYLETAQAGDNITGIRVNLTIK